MTARHALSADGMTLTVERRVPGRLAGLFTLHRQRHAPEPFTDAAT